MKLPFVRRSTLNKMELHAETGWREALEAQRRADRAKLALATAFGVSVQDVIDADIIEYRLHVSRAVLRQYRGDTKKMIRDRLHRELDLLITGPPTPTDPNPRMIGSP